MKMKKGISLVVLVITIIVMIIIAGAIIISLSNSNVIDQADNAVATHNVSTEKETIIVAYNSYEIEKLDNPAAKLQIEGAEVTGNAREGWTIIFDSANRYILSAEGEVIADGVQEYEKVDWKYAWTSDGTTWSDMYNGKKLEKGTKVEGKIVAKIYETDEIIEACTIDEVDFSSGKGYILDIQGEGAITELYNENGDEDNRYYAWKGELLKYCLGEKNDPIVIYITKVIIGEGITNIPREICSGGLNMKEISISNTVTTIGNSAFYGTSISSITIPDSVQVIENSAFRICKNLKSVILGKGIVQIGNSAFSECERLDNIVLPESLEILEHAAFEYTAINRITIPSNIREMGSHVFLDCDNLEVVIIEPGVKQIGTSAFYNCDKLKNVYIEATSNEFGIGANAFGNIADNSTIYVRNETIKNILNNEQYAVYDSTKTTISPDYNWTAPTN